MKILLVNPPVPFSYYNREYYLPSGLLYLAAVLQKNGDEIKLLDLKCSKYETPYNRQTQYKDVILNSIASFKPDLIGLGCLFSGTFTDILKFSEILKEKVPGIPILTGGIHPTIYPSEILTNCPSIDWIILGEGEQSIIQLVNTIKDKSYKLNEIDGFAFRKNGKVVVNQKKYFIDNLNTIPFPAYNIVNMEDYFVDTSNWFNPKKLAFNTSIPIITSRSCPRQCPFCSMYTVMGTKWRARSPKNVVDEMEFIYNHYKQNHFSFMDDNLTLKKSHILEICNEIKNRKLNIQFETPNGLSINTLDKEVLDAMVSTGLTRISLAIESGSDFIRNKIMRKNISNEKILEIINLTKKYKSLQVKAFFIIGMPEETNETLMETYNMIKEINIDRVYVHNLIPFPNTAVFEQALRDNLFIDINPKDFYKSDALYVTNFNRFFIKPYKLTLSDLQTFRTKCDLLISSKGSTALNKSVLSKKEAI